MCQNLPPGDFFFWRGKNTPDPIVCQFTYICFFFPAKNKTKKGQYITGWFDSIQVWRVYTQGNYL